jgi:hypothetical protein
MSSACLLSAPFLAIGEAIGLVLEPLAFRSVPLHGESGVGKSRTLLSMSSPLFAQTVKCVVKQAENVEQRQGRECESTRGGFENGNWVNILVSAHRVIYLLRGYCTTSFRQCNYNSRRVVRERKGVRQSNRSEAREGVQ